MIRLQEIARVMEKYVHKCVCSHTCDLWVNAGKLLTDSAPLVLYSADKAVKWSNLEVQNTCDSINEVQASQRSLICM